MLDASVTDEPCDFGGRLIRARRKTREYWYLDIPAVNGGKIRKYVGPADNPETVRWVNAWKVRNDAFRVRKKIVSVLIREAYLPRPDKISGAIIEALTADGVVSPGMILIGKLAYEAYSGMLGVRLPDPAKRAAGVPVSASRTISFAVRKGLGPGMLDVLRQIDPSFREYHLPISGHIAGRFISKKGYEVEFLTASREVDYYGGRLARFPPLGQSGRASPRAVDFLAHQSIRAILLCKAGLFIAVPTPERYAIHALLKAGRQTKVDERAMLETTENLMQAQSLMAVLIQQSRTDELARVYMEACDCGPYWKGPIRRGLNGLETDVRLRIQRALADSIRKGGDNPASYEIDVG